MKPVYFVILGIVLGLAGFFLIIANPFGLKIPRPVLETITSSQKPTTAAPSGAEAAPTPFLVLPSGKQTFYVRGGENDFSKITQVVVDPLDASKGVKQTVEISIDSVEPVTTFSLLLATDNGTQTFTPTLKSGNATKGVWSVSYTFPDTALKNYSFSFEMITQTNKKTIIPFLVR